MHRKDLLSDSKNLYVIIILRHLKRANGVTIFIYLKMINRSIPRDTVYVCLQKLIAAGYASQNSRGSLYYLTESGKQALKDFNNAIECADYVNYNKKAPIGKKVKRPDI